MRVVVAVVVLLAAVVTSRPAAADQCKGKDRDGNTVTIGCGGGQGGGGGGGGGSGVSYEPEDLITAISEVEGESCTIVASITSPQGQDALLFENALANIPLFGRPLRTIYQWIVNGLPGCPSAQPSPEAVAWSFVRTAAPPESQPHIAPGHAITGKKAYLETQGATTANQTFDTVLGPLTVRFEARSITIDWGDGSGIDKGPFALPSRPYPHGEATHIYTDAGRYDVVVRTAWVAHWSVGGEGGTLDGLTRTERIDDFEARQVQAVRDA